MVSTVMHVLKLCCVSRVASGVLLAHLWQWPEVLDCWGLGNGGIDRTPGSLTFVNPLF